MSSGKTIEQPQRDEIPQDKEVRLITEPGTYEISEGPSGVSRVRLFQMYSTDEADALLSKLLTDLKWIEVENFQNGVTTIEPRLVSFYGDFSYTYWGVTHEPTIQWPEVLLEIRKKVEECAGCTFNSVLGNFYRTGKDHVVWHSDDEKDLGDDPVIASLSFGEPRRFELRKSCSPASGDAKEPKQFSEFMRMPLAHGSLLIMEGSMQTDWQHRIPIESEEMKPRINLTYRNVGRSKSK